MIPAAELKRLRVRLRLGEALTAEESERLLDDVEKLWNSLECLDNATGGELSGLIRETLK